MIEDTKVWLQSRSEKPLKGTGLLHGKSGWSDYQNQKSHAVHTGKIRRLCLLHADKKKLSQKKSKTDASIVEALARKWRNNGRENGQLEKQARIEKQKNRIWSYVRHLIFMETGAFLLPGGEKIECI